MQERLHRTQLRTTQLDSELNFTERTLADEFRITLVEAEQRAQPIESRTAAREQVKAMQARIDALGEVNLGAVEEYERVKERLEFLGTQRDDLNKAREDLEQTITRIETEATERFLSAFNQLNARVPGVLHETVRRRARGVGAHGHGEGARIGRGRDGHGSREEDPRPAATLRRRARADGLRDSVRDAEGKALAVRDSRRSGRAAGRLERRAAMATCCGSSRNNRNSSSSRTTKAPWKRPTRCTG